MPIDPRTLHDLDIFSTAAPGGVTIFGLVNRAKSRAGSEHLRQRLASPLVDVDQIVALQCAHRELSEELADFRRAFDIANTDAVEAYLGSRWQVPAKSGYLSRAAQSLWLSVVYTAYWRELEGAHARVAALLGAAMDLERRLSGMKSDRLRRHGEALKVLLESPTATDLLRHSTRRAGPARVAFDSIARGEAQATISAIINEIGSIEAAWSIAAATVEHGWAYPRPSGRLRVVGLVHPFVMVDAVPNDLDLGPEIRACFVTGPNMAGKSTFLKAMGVAMLLAHIGAGVPAVAMDFPVVGTIFSSVQITDSIAGGESFYLAEVRRIRALATALADHAAAFAVIDEPFRGTNVHDASEATLAVLTRLAHRSGVLVFVASHIGEIGALVDANPHIRAIHFAADTSEVVPRFDFRVRNGVSLQRLGMTLLRQEQVLDILESSPPKSG